MLIERRSFLTGLAAASLTRLPGLRPAVGGALALVAAEAEQFVASGAAPSISIAVIKGGLPIWVEAFGVADRARNRAATPETLYAIASATKPFTATAVMKLIERGLIDLDAPLERYLGDIRIRGDASRPAVTVRQALQNRTGIPRHWRNYFEGQGDPPAFAEVAERFAFTTSAQGRRYVYTNMNFGLLAHAVQTVAGQPFHDFLATEILEPSGVNALRLPRPGEAWAAAVPYEDDGAAIPSYRVDEMGARDLVMTARDLARFGEAQLTGSRQGSKVLSRAGHARLIAERETIGVEGTAFGKDWFYALGWGGREDSGHGWFNYGHTGEGPGAAASLTIVPAANLVVATLANVQGPPAYMLNEMIVDALLPDFAARRRTDPINAPPGSPSPGLPHSFSGQWIGRVGQEGDGRSVRIELDAKGSGLIQMADQPPVALDRLNLEGGILSARAHGVMGTADASAWPHQLRLHVEKVGDLLEGTMAAYATRDGGGAGLPPHDQFWLSSEISLARAYTLNRNSMMSPSLVT